MRNWTLYVRLQIHSELSSVSSSDRYLSFTWLLPFVPFPGLILQNEDVLEGEIICGEITWDNKWQRFEDTLEDKTIYNKLKSGVHLSDSEKKAMMENLVTEYVAAGWKED